MACEFIQPTSVHSTAGVGYSHVAKVGNTVYLAGQIALDPTGALVGEGDIEAQAEQVYANLQAILDGDIQPVIDALATYYQTEELKKTAA